MDWLLYVHLIFSIVFSYDSFHFVVSIMFLGGVDLRLDNLRIPTAPPGLMKVHFQFLTTIKLLFWLFSTEFSLFSTIFHRVSTKCPLKFLKVP